MRATFVWLETVWQDLKYGVHGLLRSPGFTATAAITLALGIGVNTSIFSLLNALLLRPLPGARSDGLVAVYRGDNRPCSYPDFLDFQDRGNAFSGLAADMTNESALDVGDISEIILVEGVSYNYASVLETKPSLGRWFSAQDERTVPFPVVISYRVWQSRFGGDLQVIGKSVRLESQWYEVVGVAASDYQGIAAPIVTDAWVPLVKYARHNDRAARLVKDRQEGRVLMLGRVKPGIAISHAQAQINVVDERLHREYPRPDPRTVPLRVEPVRGTPDPGNRRMVAQPVTLLSVVVGLVLLIACANIANLLLTRGAARRHEVSIRLALGASRARICRQTLVESLLLSLMGATAGLTAAAWTNRVLERAISSAPSPIAVSANLSIDGRVLGFVLCASMVTTVLFGLIPALSMSRPDLLPALKGSEISSGARHRRFTLRNLYVVAQVTLSLMLLIIAGLFIRALQRTSQINPGFDPHGVVSARLYVARPEFSEAAGRELFRRILDHTRNLPGVRSATLSYASPLLTMSDCVVPEDGATSWPAVTAGSNIIGPDYFLTLGIPLLRGRAFTAGDNLSAPSVVIVNEILARRYWPGRDPVGKRVRIGAGCEKGQGTSVEIVGVVKDALFASPEKAGQPYVFFPFQQHFAGYVALLVKTGYDPRPYATVLRKELRSFDDRLRIYDVGELSDEMDKSLWRIRSEASMFGAFGVLALLVATVGLYGVIAFGVRQRTREFGIRMALGAERRDVLRLVIGDGLALTLAGVGLGLIASFAFTRLLGGFLYGLSPTDSTTFVAVALVWTTVALFASCVPAYYATKVDPLIALRYE